jgi:hypothetical protein
VRRALAAVLLCAAACGHGPERPAPVVTSGEGEITEVDIVRGSVAGRSVRVLGVRFGMTRTEAEAVVGAHPDVHLVPDTVDMEDVNANTGDAPLFKMVFRGPHGTISSLTVYPGMRPRLVGLTQTLLDGDALDPSSELGRLLGPPDRTAVTLDVPMAQLHHTTSRWNARELEVTKQDDWPGSPPRYTFALVAPDNALYGASPR